MQNAARSLVLFLRDGHTYNFNNVLQFYCHQFSKPLPLKEARSWHGLSPKVKRMTIPSPTQFISREWRQRETAALVEKWNRQKLKAHGRSATNREEGL